MSNDKARFCAGLLFALLSIVPFVLFFAINGEFGDLYRAVTSVYVANPITLVAGTLGYKYALDIQREKGRRVQFKLGCLIAIKSAVIGGFLFMILAVVNDYLSNGSNSAPVEIFGSYLAFLLGCVLLFWLILPVGGLGAMLVHKLTNMRTGE